MVFSIIIAAYNVADYIEQAISSCLSQIDFKMDDYEIIVIDDGSTDMTGKIIDNYTNYDNVRVVHQKNRGLSGTRNRGMTLAKGDFVLFLDGDDWLASNALCVLQGKTQNCDLIIFPMLYWFSESKKIPKSFGLDMNAKYSAETILRDTIGKQKLNIIPTPCKCYRRSVLQEKRQFFVEGILHEDNPFFSDTMNNFNNIGYTDECIYIYRQQRDGSITSSQTIRNFKGVIAGNKHIINTWGYRNKYVNYMVSSFNVFQNILDYDKKTSADEVFTYYRSLYMKKQLFFQMLNFPFIPKAIIRHILLMIDPMLLKKVVNILYK